MTPTRISPVSTDHQQGRKIEGARPSDALTQELVTGAYGGANMGRRRSKQFGPRFDRFLSPTPQAAGLELTPQIFEEAKADLDAGRVITVTELAAKLRCSNEKARLLARQDPAVIKKGIIRVPASAERRIFRMAMMRSPSLSG
jgi:hypothetical protein